MTSQNFTNLTMSDGDSGTFEGSTYFISDPTTQSSAPNSAGVLHLAAWRGDVWYIQQLIQHGVDTNAACDDGRNALHVLYLTCNKPSDLLRATKTLIEGGVDIAAKDGDGHTPLMVLLPYVFKKCPTQTAHGDLCAVVLDCVEALLDASVGWKAGVDVKPALLVQTAVEMFADSLTSLEDVGCDDSSSSYSPYTFDINRLTRLVSCLVRRGCQISQRYFFRESDTPLHVLAGCVRHLPFTDVLNTPLDVAACFRLLLHLQPDVNTKNEAGRTPLHVFVDSMTRRGSTVERHLPIIALFARHNADFNSLNDSLGGTVLHGVIASVTCMHQLLSLLRLCLRCGASPDVPNRVGELPIQLLLKSHVIHHLPPSPVTPDLGALLRAVHALAATMRRHRADRVFRVYRTRGCNGVLCTRRCPVYRLLHAHCSVAPSLQDSCRQVIWEAMGSDFNHGVWHLPLPEKIREYLYDLGDGDCRLLNVPEP
ncbi:hypothetical protein NP493_378g03009 [Ridgeia piscesae]|uniref:SOCS box domain-containing protein n=1 Tax=Ridgeia piscesae TaxID=27915 RepID=A0AAD9L3M5_RIDPI|nr:hypothetical protein NP493_378g03009 [Ridgeia piscesae]